uniref:Tr-type G domain-containing protein n=1 Tax=Strigamia maritima TaxID=126957 RepID=T1IIF1_STRMM
MAHVDAGKTTTTERMLYYSGFIRTMGEIDDGDTTMDYMEQERSRGITINSAAITFNWKNHKINLVDTPGHVDFTMEVERAICALDGAITILDASAGVEPQTFTVWKQANRYEVPRIIYLNKMDKPKASLEMCIQSIEQKLKVEPLLLNLPMFKGNKLNGLIDLINMKIYKWNPSNQGKTYIASSALETEEIKTLAIDGRRKLIESAADFDTELTDLVLSSDNWENVDSLTLQNAIRRITLSNTQVVPVFCGSSYKNIGVQLLMDAIVDYLPSPLDVKCKNVQYYDGQFSALVFKILYDSQRDFVNIIRIYSGELNQGQKLFNVNQKCVEKVGKIFTVYADEYEQIEKATAGNIVAVTGLKNTVTGNTIVSSSHAANAAMKKYAEEHKNNVSDVAPLLGGLQVPDPVFFCSIEPSSLSQQKPLENALLCLKREDPSLRVDTDSETGQTVLSGMGELHLDIIIDRIQKQYKVKADIGPLQVSYRETVQFSAVETVTFNHTIGGTKSHVMVTLGVKPSDERCPSVKIHHSRENQENLTKIRKPHLQAIENGVKLALLNGPVLGFPVENVEIGIHWLDVDGQSPLPSISAAASKCVGALLRKAGSVLLEPVMSLEVIAEPTHLHGILGDLNRRRAQILQIGEQQNMKTLNALVPLADMVGYSTSLRIITSGLATFTMMLDSYQVMTAIDQEKTVKKLTGFT